MYSVIVSRRKENTALVTSELLHHGDRHLPRLKVPDLLCLANQRPEATCDQGLRLHNDRLMRDTYFTCLPYTKDNKSNLSSLPICVFCAKNPRPDCINRKSCLIGVWVSVTWRVWHGGLTGGGRRGVSLPSPHFPPSHPGQALAILSGEYDALITDFIPSLSIAAQFSSAEDYWRH